MKLETIYNEIIKLTDFKSSDYFLISFINQTISEICNEYNWNFLNVVDTSLNTTLNNQEVSISTLPYFSKIKRFLIIINNVKYKLDYVQSIEIDNISDNLKGKPQYYDVDYKYKVIRLYPTPDNIYKIELHYIKAPVNLAEELTKEAYVRDKDKELILDDKFKTLLVQGTIIKIYNYDSEFSKAQNIFLLYKQELQRLIDLERENYDFGEKRIRPLNEQRKYLYRKKY